MFKTLANAIADEVEAQTNVRPAIRSSRKNGYSIYILVIDPFTSKERSVRISDHQVGIRRAAEHHCIFPNFNMDIPDAVAAAAEWLMEQMHHTKPGAAAPVDKQKKKKKKFRKSF